MSSLLGFPLHISVLKVLRSSVLRNLLTKCYPKELNLRMYFHFLNSHFQLNSWKVELIILFHK